MNSAIEVRNFGNVYSRMLADVGKNRSAARPAPSGGDSSKAGGAAQRSSIWNLRHSGVYEICAFRRGRFSAISIGSAFIVAKSHGNIGDGR